jgi:hypothetical protein
LTQFFSRHPLRAALPCKKRRNELFFEETCQGNFTGQVQTESATAKVAPVTGTIQITKEKTDHAIELCRKEDMSGSRNFRDRDWKNHG